VRSIDKVKALCGQAFGWTFSGYGPQYAEFSDGAMKGGFTPLAPQSMSAHPQAAVVSAAWIPDLVRDDEVPGFFIASLTRNP
jgi:hypothetical protein